MILFNTFLSVETSKALVASSSNSIGASRSRALAMAILWHCPSDKPRPRAPILALMPTSSRATTSLAHAYFNAFMISSSLASSLTILRFSAIVPEKMVFPCGT